jgi:hypothetical protein
VNWKLKAFVQSSISAMPRGTQMNYLLQRYVSRTLPPSTATMSHTLQTTLNDFRFLEKHMSIPLDSAKFYEFGAGVTLIGPLTFYCMGVEKQTLVDLHWLLRRELVNHAIRFLRNADNAPFRRKPVPLPDRLTSGELTEYLKSTYGIDYNAPCDARNTHYDSGSFDVVTSKAVFEHVPGIDIPAILAECHRLLAAKGLAAFRTDYQDHYSYCDSRVSIYNFLRYSDAQWRRYSPALNYTNRLRHREYLSLFRAAGFEIVADNTYDIRDEDRVSLRMIPLSARFAGYSEDELALRGAHTVLRNAAR